MFKEELKGNQFDTIVHSNHEYHSSKLSDNNFLEITETLMN